jgi:ribonuclease HII
LSKQATTQPVKGELEKKLQAEYGSLVGLDEVGRGCLAGPVFAACVAINFSELERLDDKTKSLIRDSKTLSAKQREKIIPVIKQISDEAYIAHATVREIEQLGIVDATFLAMRRALSLCRDQYEMVLIDGNIKIRHYAGRQTCVIGGDGSCFSIAAASILAKDARDKFMKDLGERFPAYGFEKHVGYGTAKHMQAIKDHGICELHRRNFAPIRKRVAELEARQSLQ